MKVISLNSSQNNLRGQNFALMWNGANFSKMNFWKNWHTVDWPDYISKKNTKYFEFETSRILQGFYQTIHPKFHNQHSFVMMPLGKWTVIQSCCLWCIYIVLLLLLNQFNITPEKIVFFLKKRNEFREMWRTVSALDFYLPILCDFFHTLK